VLSKASAGETYEITVVKEGQYNNWTNAVKSDGAASSVRSASTSGVTPTTSPKSTYETPEERAKKQVYIVRQSSLSTAVDLLSVGSKSRPDVKEVIDVASQLEAYVFGNNEVKVGADAYVPAQPSDLDDDIPF
jgi:hypothetical protein